MNVKWDVQNVLAFVCERESWVKWNGFTSDLYVNDLFLSNQSGVWSVFLPATQTKLNNLLDAASVNTELIAF